MENNQEGLSKEMDVDYNDTSAYSPISIEIDSYSQSRVITDYLLLFFLFKNDYK